MAPDICEGFNLSVVYCPGKDNTVADCLSCWGYPSGKAWMDISRHGDAEEGEEAKRIIEHEKAMDKGDRKCSVLISSKVDLSRRQDARVRVLKEETLEEDLMAPIDYVEPLLMEDWSEDYVASEHWKKYWNAMSALSGDESPKGVTEDGDKLFLNDKLLVLKNRVEALIDDWHNAELIHPGRHKMQTRS